MSEDQKFLRLLIVEGPAGSGKSTLIQQLIQAEPLKFALSQTPYQLDRPRDYADYDPDNGAGLAVIKDLAGLIGAVSTWKRSPELIYILDRYIWSSIVYGCIRNGSYQNLGVSSTLFGAFDKMSADVRDFLKRSHKPILGDIKDEPYILPLTLFNIPTATAIQARRKAAQQVKPRKYPFKASTERKFYNWAADSARYYGFHYLKFSGDIFSQEAKDLPENILASFQMMEQGNRGG